MKSYADMIKKINENYDNQNDDLDIDGLKELSDYLKNNFPKEDKDTIVEEEDKAKGK